MNAVGTVLLTGIDNPLCPGCDNYQPDLDTLRAWLKSLTNCSRAVIVHDELPPHQTKRATMMTHVPVQFIKVEPTDENLFFQRWEHHLAWLNESTDVDWVWLTDGSDVRMLNAPWQHMKPGVLYVGSEDDTVSNRWILNNHPSLHGLAERTPDARLLNAGLVGGDRATVVAFLSLLRGMRAQHDLTDMGIFNLAVYEMWFNFAETGHPIHTKFNDWVKTDPVAWWAHK